MWRILQQSEPDDYVLATGHTTSIREFVGMAFREAGIELSWSGEGVHEQGRDAKSGKVLVEVDPRYFRPTEVDLLLGDPSKAREKLGWTPTHSLEELVRDMMHGDLAEAERDAHMIKNGFAVQQSRE
jgi:GDPmannose 4,6-dehydratase